MFKADHPNYFYTSDKIRIFYNTNFNPKEYDPQKPLLVFVYGLLCSNYHFKYQIPFFEELGYQILIHDYRFHFASSQDGDINSCTFSNIAKDLNELIDNLNVSQIDLVGHSMGVNICLEMSKLYPQKVRSMTLISGTVVPPQDIMFDSNIVDLVSPYVKNFSTKYPRLYNTLWKNAYLNPLMHYIIMDGGFNPKQVEMEFVQLYMKKISELPNDLFFHLLKIMQEHDIISYLPTIKTHTLVVGGDKDKIIPNYLQKILTSNLKNAELYIVKDGSHVPQVDFPEIINQRIHRFLIKNHQF